ncbi:Uu.00g125010.m01.CDS01 [Anthostomella pinea]|uniref:Uu.00g125010.m01.CDS01 n=1 Tax=Anthostomella pinea TaxID=933095 RepID=A0AAI8VCE1_9PEZI|nr:Uu.00g125010.m01.CDS01 [Anthostomella pinea]
MKVTSSLASLLALAGVASANPTMQPRHHKNHSLPKTMIAGVEVIDTQIVRDAQALIKDFVPYLYYHQMRSWLFGVAGINANETLKGQIDLEVHAVGTLLHDLGWDMTPGSPYVSNDKRFEVDGALHARDFILNHPDAKNWDKARIALVYDGILLHNSAGLAPWKEPDVSYIVTSIGLDYQGPNGTLITPEVYAGIAEVFPQTELLSGTNETFTWICQFKPNVTYDTSLQPYGENYVPGYNASGHRGFDTVITRLKEEQAAAAAHKLRGY